MVHTSEYLFYSVNLFWGANCLGACDEVLGVAYLMASGMWKKVLARVLLSPLKASS